MTDEQKKHYEAPNSNQATKKEDKRSISKPKKDEHHDQDEHVSKKVKIFIIAIIVKESKEIRKANNKPKHHLPKEEQHVINQKEVEKIVFF